MGETSSGTAPQPATMVPEPPTTDAMNSPQSSNLSQTNCTYGDNAYVHQGKFSVGPIQELHLHQDWNALMDKAKSEFGLIHPDSPKEWIAYQEDEVLRQGFQWVRRHHLVNKVLSYGPGPLFILDATNKGHRLAMLSVVEEARHRETLPSAAGCVAYTFCHPDDDAARILRRLTRMLLYSRRDLFERFFHDQQQYKELVSELNLPFSSLFKTLCNLLDISQPRPVCFIVAGIYTSNHLCWNNIRSAIAQSARLKIQLKWVVSSASPLEIPHALNLPAETLELSFEDVFKGLDLSSVYEKIQATTASEIKSSVGWLRDSPQPDLKMRDSNSEHWLLYTQAGREWLTTNSLVLQYQRPYTEAPAISNLDNANIQSEASELLRRFSNKPIFVSRAQVPGLEPWGSTEQIDEAVGKVLWDLFSQTLTESFKTDLSRRRYLVRLSEYCHHSLRALHNSPKLSGFSSDLLLELFPEVNRGYLLLFLEFAEFSHPSVVSQLFQTIKRRCKLKDGHWKLFLSYSEADKGLQAIVSDELGQYLISVKHPLPVQSSTEYDECLRSLKFEEMYTRMDQIENALPDTNGWLWEDVTFCQWLQCGGVLWISGPPGSGKSVLAKTILQNFSVAVDHSRFDLPVHIGGAWFYSSRLHERGISHISMLKALLSGILTHHQTTFGAARQVYRQFFDSSWPGSSWDKSLLESMLLAIATDEDTEPVLIIVDALDESADGGEENREKMLEFLSSLAFIKDSHVWIVATSRPLPEIQGEFLGCFHLPIHEHNGKDVEQIIALGIQQIREFWPSSRKRQNVLARHMHRPLTTRKSAADHRQGVRQNEKAESRKEANVSRAKKVAQYAQVVSSAMWDENVVIRGSGSGANSPLPEDPKLRPDEETELDGIRSHLMINHAGVIIWVKLVLAQVQLLLKQKNGFTLKQLRKLVEELPREIGLLYSHIIAQLSLERSPDMLRMARRIFLWVMGASNWGPLQLQHLLDGLAIPDENTQLLEDPIASGRLQVGGDWTFFFSIIYSHCGPLVEAKHPVSQLLEPVRRVSDIGPQWTAQIVHQTAKTFLEEQNSSSELQISAETAISFVRNECLRYLDLVFPVEKTTYTPVLNQAAIDQCKYHKPLTSEYSNREVNPTSLLDTINELSDDMKFELEQLGDYLDSARLFPFAFGILEKSELYSSWISDRRQSRTYLLWWLIDPDRNLRSTAAMAYLFAYLCGSAKSNGLSTLLLQLKAYSEVRDFSFAVVFGMIYGVIHVTLRVFNELQADGSILADETYLMESLTELMPRLFKIFKIGWDWDVGNLPFSRFPGIRDLLITTREAVELTKVMDDIGGSTTSDELTFSWTCVSNPDQETNLSDWNACVEQIWVALDVDSADDLPARNFRSWSNSPTRFDHSIRQWVAEELWLPARLDKIRPIRTAAFVVGGEKREINTHPALLTKLLPHFDTFKKENTMNTGARRMIWEDVAIDTFMPFSKFAHTGEYINIDIH